MPNWKELLDEIKATGSPHDSVRRKYLKLLSEKTGRNVIVYYSGWLQAAGVPPEIRGAFGINDADKNGFMTASHKLDKTKGLDLILHTPGGEAAATESIVDYLRSIWGTDIRAIVPQLAMSAGTMMVCACKSVVMGLHSSLGPIDPQIGGLPAHGVVEEFKRAASEIATDQAKIPVWQPILSHYSPTLIGECEKAIKWANSMVKLWLESGMFAGQADASSLAVDVADRLGDHALTLSHARHLSLAEVQKLGMVVEELESDNVLQDRVMSVHHACIHTLSATTAYKIIENQDGTAFIQLLQPQMILSK